MSLPPPVNAFLNAAWYDGGDEQDISVSGLISPPQLRVLSKYHPPQEDPIDNVWRVLGSATHAMVEKAADQLEGWMIEHRAHAQIGGWTVGGQADWFDTKTGHIYDLKVTSAWSALKGEPKPEWVKQLNCYAYLFRSEGYTVNKLSVCLILRDWSKSKAQENEDYPQKQLVVLNVPVWPEEQAKEYICERVKLHQYAEQAYDNGDRLPQCTDEERWARPGKFAAMKTGRTRATKLFDSYQAANEWIQEQSDAAAFRVDERPAQYPRCEGYCPVSEHCKQWKGGR